MNLTKWAFNNWVFTYTIVFLLFICGLGAFFKLGKLEDPDFTVKTAAITLRYPGASAEEVELEVTDRVEKAIQQLQQVKSIWSISKAGEATIKVNIKPQYWSDQIPQVWDELRKKVSDVVPQFPPGVEPPIISDDYGYVYGFVLALSGDGFSYKELEELAEILRKELTVIQGVARVELWGVQKKVIYLEVTEQQITELGLTPETFKETLQRQNMVVNAGGVDVQSMRMRIAPSGEFKSPEEIGELYLHPPKFKEKYDPDAPNNELIRIKDIATVFEGYEEPALRFMRFNGDPAIGISIANIAGGDIISTGEKIQEVLNRIAPELPVGMELSKVAWQSDLVSSSIWDFMINLVEAVAIVLIVLTLAMGWRMGFIIGSSLILTILGVFLLMYLYHIDLHRVSLGALIIALGMMVDNAIVVADGIVVRMERGMDRTQAVIQAAHEPAIPLLGATVVAAMAFYPIYASPEDTGEYAGSLFIVVAFSLLVSWLLAVTVTPIQCYNMLEAPSKDKTDPYQARYYKIYRSWLERSLKRRWLFLGGMVALLAASYVGFGFVKQMFFPDSTRAQFMIDFWYPAGTRIEEVSKRVKPTETFFSEDPRVESVSSFIGSGPPRFYLPLDSELPYPNYAQLIVNTKSYLDVDPLMEEFREWSYDEYSQPLVQLRKFVVGVGTPWPLEWHITGPGEASLKTLRELGDQAEELILKSDKVRIAKTAMMNQVMKVVPEYDQARGRWAGVERDDIGEATLRAYDGAPVGLYREGRDLYPIKLRHTQGEREHAMQMATLQVKPRFSDQSIPLAQVTNGVETKFEDPYIIRWNRRRANTLQAQPYQTTYAEVKKDAANLFKDFELPPYYEVYFAGEDEKTRDSQRGLQPGIFPAAVIMLSILVGLFNSILVPLIIVLTIPFAFIGVTFGLLILNSSFGFIALLGVMSLAGMMIKNAVVLMDQINVEIGEGRTPYEAIINSGVSRLRPVFLGAVTTVFGVIPLLQDVFWESMTVAIMGGLTFGTLLTMFLVPVLYAVFYRVVPNEKI